MSQENQQFHKQIEQPIIQKRSQFHRNPYTLSTYKIDGNTGKTNQVDNAGAII